MRQSMLVLLIVCATLAVESRSVAESGGDEVAAACAACEPRWSATAGGIYLNRSKARPGTLVLDGTTHDELSNVADFDPGWAAGPEVELTRHFDAGWDLGVRYFGIDGWDAARSLSDPGNLRVPMVSNDPADFFDTASARYTSRLYNTELNLKRNFGERLRLLAGFRYVELHERVSSAAYSPTLEGTFDVGASNYLYGFQLGAESTFYEIGGLRFEGFLKAGVYGDHIRGLIDGEGTYYSEHASGAASHTSFLGEIGLTAKYQFGRHVAVYGGYEVMWLEGVVLAGDYVSSLVSPSPDFDLFGGSAFYHGVRTGVEVTW